MQSLKPVAAVVAVALSMIACNRDPNVAKRRYLESGNKYFARAKYKEASIMYRNALQKDLRYGPAHYRLGLTYVKLGQWGPAVQSLRRAVELLPTDQPDHWDAVVQLSDIYLSVAHDPQSLEEVDGYVKQLLSRNANSYDGQRLKGDLNYLRAMNALAAAQKQQAKALLDEAIADYRKADTMRPAQTGVSMQLARGLAMEGDFQGAEQTYRAVIAKDKTFDAGYTELYRLYMSAGKADDAEQVLKLAWRNNPKKYEFLTLLASHYYAVNRRADMANVLQQIESRANEYSQAYLTVGDFYARTNDNAEAIREYQEGIAKDAKQRVTYQKRIIDVQLRQGKTDEAAAENAQILKEDPKDVDARELAASLLLDKGDVAKAFPALQAIAQEASQNPVAHYNLARAHQARGETEQARQELQKAIDLQPNYVTARLALAQLQLGQHAFDAAYQSAAQILALDRNNAGAQLVETAALMGQKKIADASALLNQMVKANPKDGGAWFQMGFADVAQRKYKEAEDAFGRAYQLNPQNVQALMGEVQTYIAENRAAEGLRILQAEADKNPQRADLRVALGNTAVLTGKYDMAIADYQKALGPAGGNSKARGEVYLRLGETYRRKGDSQDAIASLEEARKDLPDNAVVLSTLARVLDGAGRKAEARQSYEALIKLNPNDAVALNNLAFLIADDGGDLDRALTLAQRAKQLMPDLPEVSDTLGWIYLKKNLSDNALDIFQKLVTKQPNQAIFRYHLGMALSQKGDRPRAVRELEQALKSNPPKEEKEKIQQLMSRL